MCFIDAGNDSKVDGLVNFEKLRMIAKEIRQVVRMTSANMDPAVMFRQRCAMGGAAALWGDLVLCVHQHVGISLCTSSLTSTIKPQPLSNYGKTVDASQTCFEWLTNQFIAFKKAQKNKF